MKRLGQKLTPVPEGNRRRLADAKSAWRKMIPLQRATFLNWILTEGGPGAKRVLPPAPIVVMPENRGSISVG